ncbi:PTS lactose/cellobiose transporter subunit IIA [Vagococcus penaei]|uniref:PTS lactose/cellobiose transporter subunit IIA n=1 Tax=Vagococcus penaei TaxID=633807 RepID=A0A1Q2D736_9ENTE|nr:PTS lactose/cellobiose transporter subunit IIA [Vagococcus penaei]AQP54085.1 PTS lactose/cellobiose transporter subunit IIA [Vagococcus penaei]RST98493.1 PTS lactose/cellobiose transporter subunit IIA [Vagococcus penaei]
MEQEQLKAIMGLIIHSGKAKSEAHEALAEAKKGQFEEANRKFKLAKDAIKTAHNHQTEMLTKEASGEQTEVTLLLVHSQDHLMTAMSYVDLVGEFIDVYHRLMSDS